MVRLILCLLAFSLNRELRLRNDLDSNKCSSCINYDIEIHIDTTAVMP